MHINAMAATHPLTYIQPARRISAGQNTTCVCLPWTQAAAAAAGDIHTAANSAHALHSRHEAADAARMLPNRNIIRLVKLGCSSAGNAPRYLHAALTCRLHLSPAQAQEAAATHTLFFVSIQLHEHATLCRSQAYPAQLLIANAQS